MSFAIQKYVIVLLIGVALGMAIDRFIKLPIYLALFAVVVFCGVWVYKKKQELQSKRSNKA